MERYEAKPLILNGAPQARKLVGTGGDGPYFEIARKPSNKATIVMTSRSVLRLKW